MNKTKKQRRVTRTRSKFTGSASRPRLSVYRSNKYIYGQLINDEKAATVAAAKGTDPVKVGEELAKKAKTKKINEVVFDRGSYKYHGKVKLLADSARKGGLKF